MKAINIREYGAPKVLQIEDLPKPRPKMGEALVRLHTTGVNFIDIYMRRGSPFIQVPLPFIPGVEGAGIVEEIGSGVSEVKTGDRVAFFGTTGSYAEYVVVPSKQLIPLRPEIDFEKGAAFPLQGMTAQYLVQDIYPIQPGDHVLVHAAAGGVGLLVIQMLKRIGANVIGTVSTERKGEIARNAGADYVIIYTKEDFATETKKITNGLGADYIIDGVGKMTFEKNFDAVRTQGHICLMGWASGTPNPIEPHALQERSITISGGNVMNYISNRDELIRRADIVMDGIVDGWLKLNISHVFPLDEAEKSHALLENRQSTGKIILKIK